jgi:hypothetical protein
VVRRLCIRHGIPTPVSGVIVPLLAAASGDLHADRTGRESAVMSEPGMAPSAARPDDQAGPQRIILNS